MCLAAVQAFATEPLPTEIKEAESGNYSVASVFENINTLQNKEIMLSTKVISACAGGCKMWVADDGYTKGKPFILVRAKDDAFKFDTDLAGKPVTMKGYAVGSYLDFCPEGKTGDSSGGSHKTSDKHSGKEDGCKPRVLSDELGSITFFALTVDEDK